MKELPALSYSPIELFEDDDHSESEIFHESTKATRKNCGLLQRQAEWIMSDPKRVLMMSRGWKTYEGCETIALPRAPLGTMTLDEALRRRRSQVGQYTGEAIGLAALAAVLRTTYGATLAIESRAFPGEKIYYRGSPSAGGLYPLEIYPLILNVAGCEPGVYHFDPIERRLDVLRRGPILGEVAAATTYPELVASSAAILAVTAVLPRTITKYLFRGYRLLSYDVGILLQNLYLAGTAAGLGTCAIGGFFDDAMGKVVGVDNHDEQVMMLFSLGVARIETAPGAPPRG